MTRAWEIAKEGQKRFGGKVKEYFAQALVIAWAEAKNQPEIGLKKLGGKNGEMFFAVNDVEALEVTFLTTEMSSYNGKSYTKRNVIGRYQKATDNNTGAVVRIYRVAMHCGDIEIKLNGQMEFIKNSYDKKTWGIA